MKTNFLVFFMFALFVTIPHTSDAAGLVDRVPEAFVSVYGRQPTASEKAHWVNRVNRKEKTTYDALKGAMAWQKAQVVAPAVTSGKIPAAADDKNSMIKAVLPLFISVYGNNPTEAEKAWWRKRINCGEIKKYSALVASMKFHKAKKARKGASTICQAQVTKTNASSVAKRALAGFSNHVMGDEVRIGIYKTDGRAIHVTANGSFQVREGNSKILATVGKDDVVEVSWSDGKYHVRGSGLELDPQQAVRLVPLNSAIMQIKSYSDPSVTYPDKNYNRFRGVIEIRKCDGCGELWAINELRAEYYLRGLAETSGQGPEEYIKALGVAARSYVLYHKIVTGGRYTKQKFDIKNTADDQLYRGYEYEIITSRMSSIFNAVKGVVATTGDGDKPVVTVYFSDSDGRTRSAQEAWNSSRFPHLQSVDDPHHASSTCKGHCVGMSAQGAYGFAQKDNWDYQRILKYYFKDISLSKVY